MSEVDRLLAANAKYSPSHTAIAAPQPARALAVVACMDTRVDVRAALGLRLGEAHIIRNAGGRVSDDALRSLALSVHVLGVREAVLMQHTRCGLAGVSAAELRRATGADLDFLEIGDHTEALRADLDRLAATPFLEPLAAAAGLLFDVDSGTATLIAAWQRDQL